MRLLLRLVMTIFFTADTDFGDHRVLSHSKRPFGSVAEMGAAMHRCDGSLLWASEDEVWHLGDFAETRKVATATLPCPKWPQALYYRE